MTTQQPPANRPTLCPQGNLSAAVAQLAPTQHERPDNMIIGTVRPEEARVYSSHAGYHQFHADETQVAYGGFEVFWFDRDSQLAKLVAEWNCDQESLESGWYWWACLPGHMPDGDAIGPFASSQQAHEDADEWSPEYDES